MLLFVLTGLNHGEYTKYTMCNNLVVIIKITIVVCIVGFARNYDHNHNQNYVRNYKVVVITGTTIVFTIMVIVIMALLRM